MKVPNDFTLYNTKKTYKPVFNLGDVVVFITDNDENEFLVYAYLIDIKDDVRYSITRKGESTIVGDFEIKLKD